MMARTRRFGVAVAVGVLSVGTVLPWAGGAAVLPLSTVESSGSLAVPTYQTERKAVVFASVGIGTQLASGHKLSTLASAGFSEFRDVAQYRPANIERSTDMWAEKLLAIGVVSSYGSSNYSFEQVLRDYAGGDDKFAALFAKFGTYDETSSTNYLVPRCDTWACGEFESSIPAVVLPLVFAVIALFAVSRIRRKRVTMDQNPAEFAS